MVKDTDGMRRQTDVRREGIIVSCLLRLDSTGKDIEDYMNIQPERESEGKRERQRERERFKGEGVGRNRARHLSSVCT